jgi:hypothetical protein
VTCHVKGAVLRSELEDLRLDVLSEMLSQLQVVEVPLQDYFDNLRSSLDCGLKYGVQSVENAKKISFLQSKYISHVMNEAGIATNTVCSLLSKRNRRSGLFFWENKRHVMRIGSTLFVTNKYVPLRKRARVMDSKSDDACDLDNLAVTVGASDVSVCESLATATDDDLMARICLRINISTGGRTTRMIIRSKAGHILKTGKSRYELAKWVQYKYGESYEEHVSCS